MGLAQMSPLAGLELPFSGSTSTPESAPSEAGPVPSPGETASIGETSPLAHLALPFGTNPGAADGASEQPSALTLEQYASLWASCELDPGATSAIEQRYGIHRPDERQALDARWRAQLEADPSLRARFDQLVIQYRDWVQKQGR